MAESTPGAVAPFTSVWRQVVVHEHFAKSRAFVVCRISPSFRRTSDKKGTFPGAVVDPARPSSPSTRLMSPVLASAGSDAGRARELLYDEATITESPRPFTREAQYEDR